MTFLVHAFRGVEGFETRWFATMARAQQAAKQLQAAGWSTVIEASQ